MSSVYLAIRVRNRSLPENRVPILGDSPVTGRIRLTVKHSIAVQPLTAVPLDGTERQIVPRPGRERRYPFEGDHETNALIETAFPELGRRHIRQCEPGSDFNACRAPPRERKGQPFAPCQILTR